MNEYQKIVGNKTGIVELADGTQQVNQTFWQKYRLRWRRRRFLFRVFRKRKELNQVCHKAFTPQSDDVLAFTAVRNEMARLPFFLDYYRKLGIAHFYFVDNDSDDGTKEFLSEQTDVSLWETGESYRKARFAVDWLGWLKMKFGHGHWCLTVDADELLVFPDCENSQISSLTSHLDSQGEISFGALMIDLYPKGEISRGNENLSEIPLDTVCWFDADGYWQQRHRIYKNNWIQGGPRARVFFDEQPKLSPTLNKIPLVKWDRRFAYVNSTHQILPIRLHMEFDPADKSKLSGALLHTKFLPIIVEKSEEELERRQHFANSELYDNYHLNILNGVNLWSERSKKYQNSNDLIENGLMSRGRIWPAKR